MQYPNELRWVAIPGFTMGKMLGYVTAETESINRISGVEEIYEFPKRLLT